MAPNKNEVYVKCFKKKIWRNLGKTPLDYSPPFKCCTCNANISKGT